MNPWLGMVVVAASFAVLMGAVRLATRHRSVHPESSRKLVHFGMGLVTLALPWLFREPWAVWVLNSAFIATLGALRFVAPLRQHLGGILDSVERKSWGEFYFPIAVAIVFTLAHQQRAAYVGSLLVLTLADAVAALVGVRYGERKYRTDDGVKSLEGSLAFFIVAVLSAFMPLKWMTTETLPHVVVAAVSVGVLATLVEAVSWRGLDNLFLPLATLVVLHRVGKRNEVELVVQLLVALALLATLLLWRRRTTLRDDALAGATLALYVCYTAGGWIWLLPPLIVALAYPLLPFRPQSLSVDVHGNWIVLAMIAPGYLWLFLEKGGDSPGKMPAFTLAIAAQLTMVFLARWKRGRPDTRTATLIVGAAATAWAFIVFPMWLCGQFPTNAVLALSLAFGCLVLVAGLFYLLNGRPTDMPNTPLRWLLQTLLALAVSTAGLLPLFTQDEAR